METEKLTVQQNTSQFSEKILKWALGYLKLDSRESVSKLESIKDLVEIKDRFIYQESLKLVLAFLFPYQLEDFLDSLEYHAKKGNYDSYIDYLIKRRYYSLSEIRYSLTWFKYQHMTSNMGTADELPLFRSFESWVSELIEQVLTSVAYFKFGVYDVKDPDFSKILIFRPRTPENSTENQSIPEVILA